MITTILAIKLLPTNFFFSFHLGQMGIFFLYIYKTNDLKCGYFKESLYNPQRKHT